MLFALVIEILTRKKTYGRLKDGEKKNEGNEKWETKKAKENGIILVAEEVDEGN